MFSPARLCLDDELGRSFGVKKRLRFSAGVTFGEIFFFLLTYPQFYGTIEMRNSKTERRREMKRLFVLLSAVTALVGVTACEKGTRNNSSSANANSSAQTSSMAIAANFVRLDMWMFTSGVVNNAIIFECSDETVTFECKAWLGGLFTSKNFEKIAIAKSGDTLYWQPVDDSEDGEFLDIEHTYIDVIAQKGDKIIGYSVIEVLQNASPFDHMATILKSEVFANENGEYSYKTQEEINALIDAIKTNG